MDGSAPVCVGMNPKAKGLGKPIFGEGGLSVRREGGSNFFSKQGGKGKAIFFARKRGS